MAAAGAFDTLDPERARCSPVRDALLAVANRRALERAAGQSALFATDTPEALALPKVPGWSQIERLQREFDAVGFFLSGHPLDAYAGVLARLRVVRWATSARR